MKKLIGLLLVAMGLSVSLPAFEFSRVPAGQIKGARLSWVSNSAIKIGVGYGEVLGSYWEIIPTDTLVSTGYTLTGLTTTTNGIFHYIYIDRANSSLPNIAIRNSTTAPTLSDDFMGWYDGLDRCIGAVWVNANATIKSFYCASDDSYMFPASIILPTGTITTASQVWNLVDVSAYTPVNAYEVRTHVTMNGSWGFCFAGLMPEYGTTYYEGGVSTANLGVYLPFERGITKKIKYLAQASSTSGTLLLTVRGYRLER